MPDLLKKLLLFIVLSLTVFAGCENFNQEGGSFSARFTWPKNNKPDFSSDTYYAWIGIKEWIDGDAENIKIHLKEGPVVFDNEGKLALKLENLSYGKNRVVVVEVRKSNNDQDRTLYYGISEVFDLSPGKHTDVAVDMQFAPGTEEGKNSFAIAIFGNNGEIQSTTSEKVSLRVFKTTGSKVVFSNRLDLLDIQINNEAKSYTGSKVIDFTLLTKIDESTFEYEEWDLTDGREDAENGDGNKTVYAKVIDNNGYRSEMAYAKVTLDTTPPSVSNVTVSPSGEPGLANIGTQIVVKFIMSEPLTEFSLFSDGIEMTDRSSGSDMYFVYTITDADKDGSLYSFKVSAKDKAGNELSDFPLGNVKIDSTIPELIDFTISKKKVRTGEEFSVNLEVSEELKELNVLIGAKSISDKCNLEEGSLTKYICNHKADIDGDEGDGVKQIAVQLTDHAGNSLSETLKVDDRPVTIEYDITAPILASSVILPETVNKSSETVNLKFSFVEKVSFKLSDIILNPETDLVFDCGDISEYSKSVECSAPFNKIDERVANYSVSVSVSDEVGNLSSNIDLGTISVDRLSPSLSSQNVTPVAVKLLEEFIVTFGVSEKLLSDPVVRVGDKTLPGSSCTFSSATLLWTCTHQANKDSDEPDGQKMVSVYIVDKAGNAATEILTKSINYDATAPVLINPVFIPGTKLNSYDGLFQVRFSFSEKVRNDTSFIFSYTTDEGDIFDKPVSCSSTDSMDQSFSCVFNLLPEDSIQGKYTFFIDATDLSGNRLVQDGTGNKIGTIEIDRKLPEITISSVNPEDVNYETGYIEVMFTVNEPVAPLTDPVVKLGTNIQKTTPYSVNTERTAFTYRVSNLQMAYDGTQILSITAEDLFGNTGTASRGGIQIDRTKPTVISANMNRAVAKSGEEIVVSVTFSEKMNPATVKIKDGGLGLTKDISTSTDRIFVYRYTVNSGDVGAREKSYAVSILGNDTIGNTIASSYSIGTVLLDLTPPLNSKVVDLEITTASSGFYLVDSLPVASNYQPDIDFTFSITNADQISGNPEVYFGGRDAVLSGCTGTLTDIICSGSYHIAGNEGEGVKHMTVDLYDDAGNISSIVPGAVIFDFTGPRLVSTSITRDPAFGPSRDNANKIQHFSPKDPLNDTAVQLVMTMYADELIDTAFSNAIDHLPCEAGSYAVTPEEISGNSLKHIRNVNDCVGLYAPVVIWRDFVGNETARESDWKISVVDDQPDQLDIKRDYTTYYRKPFGSIDSTATPRFYITSSPKTVVSGDIAMVAFYTETGILAGVAAVEDDGSFSVETLTGGDVPVIYINPVSFSGTKIPVKDDLGNPYDIKTVLQPVPNVVWTANLNRKIKGSQWPNPTKFENVATKLNYLDRDDRNRKKESATMPTTYESETFSTKYYNEPFYNPSPVLPVFVFYRDGRAFAYNHAKDHLVVFGGISSDDGTMAGTHYYNDLALWDGSIWTMIESGSLKPPTCSNSTMVYVENEDYYLLFGGTRFNNEGDVYYGDTWFLNGNQWSKFSGTGPSARSDAAMAYDSRRKVVVLFGGTESSGDSADGTWEWDGTEWTNVVTTSPNPGTGQMVYDSSIKKMIYYDSVSRKTYSYDGQTWELMAENGPQRGGFRMVYNSTEKSVLLSGGMSTSTYEITNDIWKFNGSSWSVISNSPANMRSHVIWHNPSLNTVFLSFGSSGNEGVYHTKLISFSNNLWKTSSFETFPSHSIALAYDKNLGKTYQFGGTCGESQCPMMIFDGYDWTTLSLSTKPSVTKDHDMIYYPPDKVVLLYNHTTSRMWQFNGSAWSLRAPASGNPMISRYRMAYDEKNDLVVFIAVTGGTGQIQTWTYNGSVWSQKCTSSACNIPVFDSIDKITTEYMTLTQKVYAYYANETYEWTGTTWSKKTISDPENDGNPSVISARFVAAGDTGKLILTGDTEEEGFQTWMFNGTSYKDISDYSIEGRKLFDAVWMDNINAALIKGGRIGYDMADDDVATHFITKTPLQNEPSQQYSIPLVYAGIPDEAGVQKITLTWVGGGTTSSKSTFHDAFTVDAWVDGGWQLLYYGTGSNLSHATTKEEIDDPDVTDIMTAGVEQTVSFRASPMIQGGFSETTPVMSTSTVEVDIYYNVEGKRDIPRYLDSEYYIPSQQFDYELARRTCLEWGGDLLIINNADEENIIRNISGFYDSTSYWIGVNDIHKDLDFRTVSGKLIYRNEIIDGNYVKWATSQPYASSTNNCAYLLNGKWSLANGTGLKNFICEKTRENNYVISTKTETWANAKTVCESLDMDLVIINGPFEQFKIEKMIGGTTDFWMGYTDADVEGTWRWVSGLVGWIGNSTGTPYYHNNWGTGYPSATPATSDYAFISMTENMKWRNNALGTALKHYICEENSDENFCSLNNQECALSNECCSEVCSYNYDKCVSCLANGDKNCISGSNCCNGICNTSSKECVECLDLKQSTCTNKTDCCDQDATCASGKCCYGLGLGCTSESECCTGMSCGSESKCCKFFGISCQRNNDCCSNICTGTLLRKNCSCLTISQTCISDSQCCSGTCFSGSCECSETGGRCLSTGDCCVGICLRGICRTKI